MDDMKSTHGYGTGHSSGESGPEGPQDLGQRASTIRDVLVVASQGEVQIPLQEQPHDHTLHASKVGLETGDGIAIGKEFISLSAVLPGGESSVKYGAKEAKEFPNNPVENPETSVKKDDSFGSPENVFDSKSRQRTVKLGDNSITTDCICDRAIYELAPINLPSNFISSVPRSLFLDKPFHVENGVISIRSRLVSCEHYKGRGAGVTISKSVFETNAVPLLEADTKTMVVQFQGRHCHMRGKLDQSLLSKYMLGPCVNSELLNDVLRPKLMCANRYFVAYCASEIFSNAFYFDNSAMYAKLVYWALVIDYQAECGTACAWNKFDGENTITWINLDDENLKPEALSSEFGKGSIILLQGQDFNESDYQVLLWLARGGCRVSSEAGANTPDMCYVHWPTISLTLLGHGVAPDVWPEATYPGSSWLLLFASKLAALRSEHYDFCRGIYYAMDLIGVRYASAQGINYRIDSFLSSAQPRLPLPRDYNFFCRLLGIRPPDDVERKRECEQWVSTLRSTRVQLAALYVAGMQVFTTTYLHSVSLSTSNLIQWSTGSQFPHAAQRTMLHLTSGIGFEGEPLGYSVPKLAFSHYTGLIVEQGLYKGCTWGTSYGVFPDAAHCYEAFGCQKDLVPRLGSNLAIDDFLVVRPQEWGILGPNTTVDFKSTVSSTTSNRLGLYSCQGDFALTQQRLCSDFPFLVIPYGIQMLNIFSQFFKKGDSVPHYVAAKYYPGLDSFSCSFEIGNRPYEAHDYVKSLHIYEPCSIRTFDYSSEEIWSPVVVPLNMDETDAAFIRSWQNHKISGVGLILKRDRQSVMEYYGCSPPRFLQGIIEQSISSSPYSPEEFPSQR